MSVMHCRFLCDSASPPLLRQLPLLRRRRQKKKIALPATFRQRPGFPGEKRKWHRAVPGQVEQIGREIPGHVKVA